MPPFYPDINTFSAMTSLRQPGYLTKLAMVLGWFLLFLLVVLMVVPWRQSVAGKGEIIVFSPMNRPQTIHAQIDARIERWHVAEGTMVEAGQLLLTLQETKTDYLDPLQLVRLQQERTAMLAQQSALQQQAATLGQQVGSQRAVQQAAVPAAGLKVSQAKQKLAAANQKMVAAKQAQSTAQWNLTRRQELFDNGLRSKRDLELAQLDVAKADADLKSAEADVDIARQESAIAGLGIDEKMAETNAKQFDVSAKVAETAQKVAKIQQELAKLDNKIASLQQRSAQRMIHAPISGQVTRVLKLGAGETVKADTPLVRITPQVSDLAAAIYVEDWNTPLLSVGRPVRLQFSGFPAIQFSGWPSVAMGTFGGRVVAIDAADTGQQSLYRVLIKPDLARIKAGDDQPWPSSQVLRPGTQVLGWILLDSVPIWFELWRQFNGFPPTVKHVEEASYSSGNKDTEWKDPYKNDAMFFKSVKQRK